MPSSKVRGMLLVTFVVLTIIFGSLFTFELVKGPIYTTITSSTTSITTLTSTVTSNNTWTATITEMPTEGTMEIGGQKYLFCTRTDLTYDNCTTIGFHDILFRYCGVVHGVEVNVTYPDGVSSTVFNSGAYCGTVSCEPSPSFAHHSNWTAGVMLTTNETIFLVMI